MKLYLKFTALALLALCSCREHYETRSYYDEERTRLEGVRTVYSQRKADGTTAEILDGVCRSWYPSGALQEEYRCSENEIVGDYILYHANGKVWIRNHFNSAGLIDGKQYSYDRQGKLVKCYEMNAGTGIQYVYDEDGKLKREYSWVRGKLDGEVKKFDPDGKLNSIQVYKDSVKVE